LATAQVRCRQVCAEVPCVSDREGKYAKYRALHSSPSAQDHLGRSKHGFHAWTSEDPTRYVFYLCSR